MKRRLYTNISYSIIKVIFWITFAYGLVLLSTTSVENIRLSNDQGGAEIKPEARVYYNTAGSSQDATGSSTSTCSLMSLPVWVAEKERWQPIDKSRSMYSFSAYYVKEKSTVFIVGVRPRNQVYVICQFWRQTQDGHVTLLYENEADARALLDDFGYRFAPTIFECFANTETPSQYISLTTRHCETPTNILEIQNTTKGSNFERRLTVCVPPLAFQYDYTAEFIKWVEINRQLGVDHFIVYNFSSGPNIGHVLKHYSERGLAEVIQWRPPMVDDDLPSEIRPVELGNFGQTTALNDCLYRSKRTSEFITNIGLNEYILPQLYNETTIYEMLTRLNDKFPVYHVTRADSDNKSNKTRNVTNTTSENDKQKLEINSISVKNKPNTNSHKTEISSGDDMKKLIIRTPEVDFTSVHEVPGVDTYSIPSWKAVFHKSSEFGNSDLIEQSSESFVPLNVIQDTNKRIQNVWTSIYKSFTH